MIGYHNMWDKPATPTIQVPPQKHPKTLEDCFNWAVVPHLAKLRPENVGFPSWPQQINFLEFIHRDQAQ